MLSARARLILAALLLGPVLLYWGLNIAPSERRIAPPQSLQQGQDYFATDLRSREFNPQGSLSQELATPRLDHYPQQRQSVLQTPEIRVIDEAGGITTVNAHRGTVTDARDEVLLAGDVRISDTPTTGSPLQVQTEKLTFYPERSFAETDQPVTIITQGVRYEAVGMNASFDQRTLNLQSNVRGTHENKN